MSSETELERWSKSAEEKEMVNVREANEKPGFSRDATGPVSVPWSKCTKCKFYAFWFISAPFPNQACKAELKLQGDG